LMENRKHKINAFLDYLFEGKPGISKFEAGQKIEERGADYDKTIRALVFCGCIRLEGEGYILMFQNYFEGN